MSAAVWYNTWSMAAEPPLTDTKGIDRMNQADYGLHTGFTRAPRSVFGRVLCGVRLVLVRVAFVRGGRSRGGSQGGSQRRRIVEVKPKAADSPRAGHGLATDF